MMYVRLRGFMIMARHSEDGSASVGAFLRCAELFTEMRNTCRIGKQWA